jgi:hypothetical protein
LAEKLFAQINDYLVLTKLKATGFEYYKGQKTGNELLTAWFIAAIGNSDSLSSLVNSTYLE